MGLRLPCTCPVQGGSKLIFRARALLPRQQAQAVDVAGLEGLARAMGLALTGHKLSAAKAAQWGLIWECHADDQLAAAVDALCAQLSQLPTHAMVRTRQAMLAAQAQSLSEHLTYEAMLMHELGRSDDYVEGVSAFLEKRPARFNRG